LRSGLPRATDQAGDLRDLQAAVAVEQKVAEQAVGIVVVALVLAKGEGGAEQRGLLRRQALLGDAGLFELGVEEVRGRRHGSPSRARVREVVYSVRTAS
jgi:hypothetical protein